MEVLNIWSSMIKNWVYYTFFSKKLFFNFFPYSFFRSSNFHLKSSSFKPWFLAIYTLFTVFVNLQNPINIINLFMDHRQKKMNKLGLLGEWPNALSNTWTGASTAGGSSFWGSSHAIMFLWISKFPEIHELYRKFLATDHFHHNFRGFSHVYQCQILRMCNS